MNKEATKTVIKRESKNSIRAEFERTPLFERIKAKYFTLYFLQRAAWYIFRLLLLIGISYIILYPFISKISNSFKSPADFTDEKSDSEYLQTDHNGKRVSQRALQHVRSRGKLRDTADLRMLPYRIRIRKV